MAGDQSGWRRRLATSVMLAAATLLVAVIVVYAFSPAHKGPASITTVRIGGPFALTTHTGATLSDVDLKGEPFVVFFGFTHCPEVCPTTLWEMSEALKALGPEADRLKMLFVSVDPRRDNPQALALYLHSFDSRIIGLTGTEEAIGAVAKSYRAYWQKVPTENGDYTIDHAASIYLMDASGEFVGTIAYGEQADIRLAKLRKLIANGLS